MTGGPAPTFEASYARAMAKIQEDRAVHASQLRRSLEEEELRREKEFFRVSNGLDGLQDVYKDRRDPREIKKRDKSEKQKRRQAKNPGLRPRSAGVLVPDYGAPVKVPTAAMMTSKIPGSTATDILMDAAKRSGIAIGSTHYNPNPDGPGVMDEDSNRNEGNQEKRTSAGGSSPNRPPASVSSPGGTITVASDMAVMGTFNKTSDLAYTSLPFMPAPFLPMGSPTPGPSNSADVDTSKPFLSASYHRPPKSRSPQRSASENFVTGIMKPYQTSTGALPFVNDSVDSGMNMAAPTMERVTENVALF